MTKLQLDCVVTFYEADAGYYLTEQSYDVYPWANAIVISGKESNSSYEWRLSKGQLNMPGYNGQLNNLMTKMDNIYFAEAVLSLVSAPALFLDKSVVFTRGTSAINMQGRWCYPITKNQALRDASNTTFDRTVFYQNRDSLLVDMNLLSSQEDDISFDLGTTIGTIRLNDVRAKERLISGRGRIAVRARTTTGAQSFYTGRQAF